MLGFSGTPQLALTLRQQRLQEQQLAIQREGAQRVFATFGKVFDETESVFEARRQARAEHALYLAQNPEVSERVDKITALLWVLPAAQVWAYLSGTA